MSDDRTYDLLEAMRRENREDHSRLFERIDDLTGRMTKVESCTRGAITKAVANEVRVDKIEQAHDEERGRRSVWRKVGAAAWGLLAIAFGAVLAKVLPNH